ncbi:MAG: hypothetical protein JO173_00980, partial [Gammaproteobacteria bacterium]|nr:hypothetical protein [Gammaproteobacteria bacterium]
PEEQRYRAYADAEVPLARGQHMLRPSVAGRLLQALLPEPGERVLEVGGRLFLVVGTAPVMDARLVRRTAADACMTHSLFETVIDPLVNAVQVPQFRF